MNAGVGTVSPTAPLVPAWALTLWKGPTISDTLARGWRSLRDRCVKWLTTQVRDAGLVEGAALLQAGEQYEAALVRHVTSRYERDLLDLAAMDPAVDRAATVLALTGIAVLSRHPRLLTLIRPRHLVPRATLVDPVIRARVTESLGLVRASVPVEVRLAAGAVGFSPEAQAGFMTPLAERSQNSCWWAYDPGMPSEIARRLLASRRLAVALPLIRLSSHVWTADSIRRAILDWAEDVADYAGFLASLPGVDMPETPIDRRLDLGVVFEQHKQAQAERHEHFQQGLAELGSN